jgi:hypothetical protein
VLSDLWRFLSACGHRSGTVQSAREGWRLREERRTRTPRAPSLRSRFRETEDLRPKRLAIPCPRRVATAAADLQALGEEKPAERAFCSRRHRLAPSRALRPRRDSASPRLLAERPASAVTRRWKACNPVCQRSAPGLRVGFPRSIRTERGWMSRFTPLHPLRPAARSPLRRSLPEGRSPDELLALLVSRTVTGFAATTTDFDPTPHPPASRVNGEHEPADEEHLSPTKSPEGLPLVRCRTNHGASSPSGRSRSARCLRASTATTAFSLRTPDTARRLLQSTRNPSTPAR